MRKLAFLLALTFLMTPLMEARTKRTSHKGVKMHKAAKVKRHNKSR